MKFRTRSVRLVFAFIFVDVFGTSNNAFTSRVRKLDSSGFITLLRAR